MNMLLRRSPWKQYFTPEWQEKMARIENWHRLPSLQQPLSLPARHAESS